MPTATDKTPEAMLGLRIMTQLHRQQKSVYALAKQAALPVKTVQRICKGEGKQPSVWTIAAIARVLDVSIDALVGMLEATATAAQAQDASPAAPSTVKRTRASTVAPRA
jgi:DNA-binding Xre family transcriptional regulator